MSAKHIDAVLAGAALRLSGAPEPADDDHWACLGWDGAPGAVAKGLIAVVDGKVAVVGKVSALLANFDLADAPVADPGPGAVRPARPIKPYGGKDRKWTTGVYGPQAEWFEAVDWKAARCLNPLPVIRFGGPTNPWRGTAALGVDIGELREAAVCRCPCSERDYHAFVPVAVLTDDAMGHYIDRMDHRPAFADMLADAPWNRHCVLGIDDADDDGSVPDPEETLGKIARAVLGTGYTSGTMPCDGGASLVWVAIPLDNGDKLLCAAWEWCNK